MKTFKAFVVENMDHSKDSQAVPELHAALMANKEKINNASEKEVYGIIDKIMTRIAKSHGLSGQKLHDMWVKKYKQIPDTWIMNEVLDTPAARSSYIAKARTSAGELKDKKATDRYLNVMKVQAKDIKKSGEAIRNKLRESLHDWFTKEKWVRMDTKGNIKGPCAREPGEGKPKCLPQAKAHALGKKGRASAAARKRREDPNPNRRGKAINVATTKNEEKDACYYKVRSRYKVWPSAYASGALVKCRKKGAKNWGTKSEAANAAQQAAIAIAMKKAGKKPKGKQ
jgi:hypothetical protein